MKKINNHWEHDGLVWKILGTPNYVLVGLRILSIGEGSISFKDFAI
jgi:hypothetical protein